MSNTTKSLPNANQRIAAASAKLGAEAAKRAFGKPVRISTMGARTAPRGR